MNTLEKFFLTCSGANMNILRQCPGDYNKYIGIGATVFFTGFFAFIAGSYALYTVFDSIFLSAIFGLFWGSMIFNLDRFIVSSMKKEGNIWRETRMAFPRVILAILLALVISKPLELKIFEPEIRSELVLMEQQLFKEQEARVIDRFQGKIDELVAEADKLKAELAVKTARRDELKTIAQQESDGTGGTGKPSLGPIYKAKKMDADQAEAELQSLMKKLEPQIDEKTGQINEMEGLLAKELKRLKKEKYSGLAARLYALHNLTQKSQPINIANWFIMLLFIVVETSPLFVKIMSGKGPYDDLLMVHEHTFSVFNIAQIAKLNHQTNEKVKILTKGNTAENDLLRIVAKADDDPSRGLAKESAVKMK